MDQPGFEVHTDIGKADLLFNEMKVINIDAV